MLLLHPCALSLQWYFDEKHTAPFFSFFFFFFFFFLFFLFLERSYLCAGRKGIVIFLAKLPDGEYWEESKTFNVILDQQPLESLEQPSLMITYQALYPLLLSVLYSS